MYNEGKPIVLPRSGQTTEARTDSALEPRDSLRVSDASLAHLEFLASPSGIPSEIRFVTDQISIQVYHLRVLAHAARLCSPYSDSPHYAEILNRQSCLILLASRRFSLQKRLVEVRSQLNGANGEYTGLDDIAPFYQEVVDHCEPVVPPYWCLFSRVEALAIDDAVLARRLSHLIALNLAWDQAQMNLEALRDDMSREPLNIELQVWDAEERVSLSRIDTARFHARRDYLAALEDATARCQVELLSRNRRYPWYYPLYYRARSLIATAMSEFFCPGVINEAQSSDGKKKRGGASAVISTFGSHDFVVDNSVSSARREERVHAPQFVVARAVKRHPKIASDSKRIRRAAERAHQKRQTQDRDVERARVAFTDLCLAVDPSNSPQFGFNFSWFSALGASASSFASTCSSLTEAVHNFSKTFSSVGDGIAAAWPWIKLILILLVLMLSLSLMCWAAQHGYRVLGSVALVLYMAFSMWAGFTATSAILQTFFGTYESRFPGARPFVPPDAMADFSGWAKRNMEPQVGGEALPAPDPNVAIPIDSSYISKLLVAVFSGGMLTVGQKKEGFAASLKDFVVSFPSVIKGIDSIVEFVTRILFELLNKVRGHYKFPLYESLFANRDVFTGWAGRAERFGDQMAKGDIAASHMSLGILNKLIEEGRSHTQFLRSISDDPQARARLAKILHDLAVQRDRCVSFNPNFVSDRPEPVCVYFGGLPGRGKSTLIKMMAIEVLLQVLPEPVRADVLRHTNAFIYHRTPETEYWDGYARQIVTLVDDFLQKAEVPGGDSAALDVIRILNGQAALLHMADVDSKGKTYFTSEFVFISSNMMVPATGGVTDIKAVRRRPDICVRVDLMDEFLTPSKEVANGFVVDKVKLGAINALPSFSERCSPYKLTYYAMGDNDNPTLTEKLINPLEIVARVLELRKLKQNVFNRIAPEPSLLPPGFDAADFAKKLMARQGVNVAQSPASFCKQFYDHEKGGMQKASMFRDAVSSYLLSLQKSGPTSDRTIVAYHVLLPFITDVGLTWEEFSNDYSAYITEAMRVWAKSCKLEEPPLFDEMSACWDRFGENGFKGKDHEREEFEKFPTDEEIRARTTLSHKSYFGNFFVMCAINFKERVGDLFAFFFDHWKWVVAVGGVLAVAFGTYALVSKLTALTNEPESFPVKHIQGRKKGGLAQLRQRQQEAFRRLPMVSQGGRFSVVNGESNEAQGYDDLSGPMTKILSHVYHIFLDPESTETVGHVSPLVDKVFVANAHTCDIVLARAKVTGQKHVWLRRFGIKNESFQVLVDSFAKAHRDDVTKMLDLVVVHFANSGVPHACDFIKHIPSTDALEKRDQLTILAPVLGRMDAPFEYVIDHKALIDATVGGYRNPVDKDDPYVNAVNISYHFKTVGGQCGLPLVTNSLGAGFYYAGAHKCGNGVIAGAAPLLREWVDLELAELRRVYPDLRILRYMDAKPPPPPPNNMPQCWPAATVGAVPAFHGSVKSKLRPLPCADDFPLKTGPATLGVSKVDGKWRSPYYLNRAKMKTEVPAFPCVQDLNLLVSKIVCEGNRNEVSDLKRWRRVLSVEEALRGIPGSVLRAVDLKTSVGYHWVLTGKNTKQALFSDPVLYEEFKRDLAVKVAMLRAGVRPLFLNMDVLKDERRTLEKVAQCSTRVVVVGPVELLFINRMFFGGFAAWSQENKGANGLAIGMNPYADEMNDLCLRLFKDGFKQFAGDKKRFDMSQHPVLLDAIFLAINDWYGPSPDNDVRLILSLEFVQPFHLTFPVSLTREQRVDLLAEVESLDPDRPVWSVPEAMQLLNADRNRGVSWVYLAAMGHPSGSFLTALINSWYSKLEPLIALQVDLQSWETVLEICRSGRVFSATLGDDFITSVAPDLQDKLNAITFRDFCASYGMEVTRENKEPITEAFPKDDPVFLKRRLYYSDEMGRYVGALDLDALFDSFCWVRTDDPSDTDLRGTFNMALCELALHGSAVYDRESRRIVAAAIKTLKQPFAPLPWHVAQTAVKAIKDEYRP